MSNFNRKRCVFGCTTIGVSIHDFPNPDKFPEHYQRWVEIAGKPLKNLTRYEIYRKKKVCNIHFTKKDWNRNNRLNALAMPSLYLPDSDNVTLTLHQFPDPNKDPERFRTWIYTISGEILALDNNAIFKKRRVCHCHFEPRYHTSCKKLSNIAVPTLCLPVTDNIIMHLFPNPDKDTERFNVWKDAIGGHILSLDPHTVFDLRKVCHLHFEPCYHTRSKRLTRNAVPTLQLSDQKHINSTKIEDVNLKSKESQNQRDFLIDHTYSLLEDSKCGKIEGTAKRDHKIDLSTTRVNKTVDVTINFPCDNNVKYNYDVENNANYNYDDDNVVPNTPDDDVVRNTSVIEVEILPQDLFSWEKTDVILADDTEVVLDETVDPPEVTLDFGDVSMYNDEQPTKDDTGGEFAEYRCNECGNIINGFRYTCVQCVDWDLCAACEAHATHDTHYVLRVPGQRPYKEMQAVLAAIRLQMLREDLFLPGTIASIKEEVKDEDSEVPESAPQVEADPLAAWDISQHDDDCSTLEIYPERKDEDGGPSRKRRTSVDSLDNTQNLTSHGNDDSSYNGLATMADDVRMESNTDGDTCPNFDYSEPIQIIDIDKLIKTHEQTESTKTNYNDTLQITKEFCTVMSHRDSILDPCKPKLQDNKREKLIDISIDITHHKTINLNSHTKDDTHRIITHSKETGTDAKGIEAPNEAIARPTKETGRHSDLTRALSQRRKGIDSKVIRSRNISNTNDKTKKRYKILLPPGAQWKQLLMTMLKSRVTVPLEDVMRKEQVRKNTEIVPFYPRRV